MTNYAAGRRKEWDVVRRLRADGWEATRSAGSHGLWDVVAVKRGRPVRLIQVKYTRLPGGRPWIDANAEKLARLAIEQTVPMDFEIWVYRRGDAMPTIWAPTPAEWVEVA